MTQAIDMKKVDELIGGYPAEEPSLIQVLQDVQAEYNYLPKEAIERVAEKLDLPLAKVYAVATFYKAFSLKPRGKKICKVCMGTACHIRGGQALVDELERVLDVKAGNTTKDGEFTLETVNCVGACAMAPVIIVGDQYHGSLAPHQVKGIIEGGGEDEDQ